MAKLTAIEKRVLQAALRDYRARTEEVQVWGEEDVAETLKALDTLSRKLLPASRKEE